MAALGTFAVGQYTAAVSSTDLGLTTSEGWRLRYRPAKKKINDTNLYGDTLIDGIYRGMEGVQLMTTFKEWKTGMLGLLWPYGAAAFDGTLGTVGVLDSALASTIVLTAASGTPAATAGPATLTAHLAILSPDNDIEVLMAPDERNVPVLFDLLLANVSSVLRFFTKT